MIYFPSRGSFPIVWPLFQPFSLSSSHISTNIHTHCFFFSGFSALQSILRLLPTFIFPPLANHFNYLAHFFSLFIQPVFSVYLFSQFFGHFFNPVGKLSHMFTPTSMPAAYLTGFPAIYLSNKFSYS